MYPGFWQILLVIVVLVLLFGRGKISELMADTAKGIKSFKKGMSDDEVADTSSKDPKVIEGTAAKTEDGTKVS
ncbi:MAG: twin-arginine translocase TatA/TatE family subunit [Pseudomonadota bacterium]